MFLLGISGLSRFTTSRCLRTEHRRLPHGELRFSKCLFSKCLIDDLKNNSLSTSEFFT